MIQRIIPRATRKARERRARRARRKAELQLRRKLPPYDKTVIEDIKLQTSE